MTGRGEAGIELAATVAGLVRLPFLLLLVLGQRLWRGWNSYRAAAWTPKSATVESVSVRVRRTCLTRAVTLEFADAELAYSYESDGERYAGYHRRAFFDEQRAWIYADRWRSRQVVVRCDAGDHNRSFLLEADQPGAALEGIPSFQRPQVKPSAGLPRAQKSD
ncbi:MAG TPA: hypothetical protein VGF06_05195 [Terriglobales bacterium]|jgi:hypothetical protein